MKQYKDLSVEQKCIFDKIERIFIEYSSITVKDFVTALGVLLNKYKNRGVKDGNDRLYTGKRN